MNFEDLKLKSSPEVFESAAVATWTNVKLLNPDEVEEAIADEDASEVTLKLEADVDASDLYQKMTGGTFEQYDGSDEFLDVLLDDISNHIKDVNEDLTNIVIPVSNKALQIIINQTDKKVYTQTDFMNELAEKNLAGISDLAPSITSAKAHVALEITVDVDELREAYAENYDYLGMFVQDIEDENVEYEFTNIKLNVEVDRQAEDLVCESLEVDERLTIMASYDPTAAKIQYVIDPANIRIVNLSSGQELQNEQILGILKDEQIQSLIADKFMEFANEDFESQFKEYVKDLKSFNFENDYVFLPMGNQFDSFDPVLYNLEVSFNIK